MTYSGILEAKSKPVSGLQVDATFTRDRIGRLLKNFEQMPEHVRLALYELALEFDSLVSPETDPISAKWLNSFLENKYKLVLSSQEEWSFGGRRLKAYRILHKLPDGKYLVGAIAKRVDVFYFSDPKGYATITTDLAVLKGALLDNINADFTPLEKKLLDAYFSRYELCASGKCSATDTTETRHEFNSKRELFAYFKEHRNDLPY